MNSKRRQRKTTKPGTKINEQHSEKRKLAQKKAPDVSVKTVRKCIKSVPSNNSVKKETHHDCENLEIKEAFVARSSVRKSGVKRKKTDHTLEASLSQPKQCAENFEKNVNEESDDHSNNKNRKTKKHTSKCSDKAISKSTVQAKHIQQSPDNGIVLNNSSSESEWEEVQEKEDTFDLDDYNPEIPKEGVEITINTENSWLRKRCRRKEIDLVDIIRRQVNRFKKDIQVALHKVHLLCLLARGQFLNSILLKQDPLALMLSVIPSEMHNKSKMLTLDAANKLLVWFCKHFHYHDENQQWETNIENELMKCVQVSQVNNHRDLSMLFVLAVRSLGYEARLCLSLNPISMKSRTLQKISKKNLKLKQEISNKKLKLNEEKNSAIPIKQIVNKTTTNKKSIVGRTRKKRAKNSTKHKSSDSEAGSSGDFEESPYKPPMRRSRTKVSMKESSDELTDDSDEDFVVTQTQIGGKKNISVPDVAKTPMIEAGKKLANRKILSSDESDENNEAIPAGSAENCGIDHWAEVYAKDNGKLKWLCVDCIRCNIGDPYKIEETVSQPITYVLAYDNDNCVKDVTKRYASKWMTQTRKVRVDEMWWQESLEPFLSRNRKRSKTEDAQLNEIMETMPLPTTIGEFKDHPLYALQRHLLKFQGIYPPDAPPLGFVRKEAVYSRECVHTLHSRETWLKQARVVRIGEEPYKIVKARPKWNKITRKIQTDLPLDVFGKWQTEEYIPPVAENGKVPRNDYGNVELFQPSMLPIGTVHIQVPALNRVAKKLNIDCCPAVVGFDGNWGSVHPVFDGWIVCEEFKDVLLAAWEEDQENQQKRENEKREKRIYGNWKRLIKGLLIRERLKLKYDTK